MPISRSYRPRFFRDVTGQQHITETLRKEVESGILGHAFLFSGPRGVGKTTTARIFAKALLSNETCNGEPDDANAAVQEVDKGSCIDLVEIDAASHTGVENVREAIIEHVRFPPAKWKRKVYIIDECHMLSPSAWNAMLKTLEEPPDYAFFILATTELHKVPETIKSRCQRFEFRRIEPEPMKERIRFLAKQEGFTIEDCVVDTIVEAGDGCLRDAESMLDQLASLGETTITAELADLILPRSNLPRAADLLLLCAERNIGASMAALRGILDEGLPPSGFLNDLLAVTRKAIQAEDPDVRDRLQQSDRVGPSVLRLLDAYSENELSDIALLLIERRRDMKTGVDPVFVLELSIFAIAGGMLLHAVQKKDPGREKDPPQGKRDSLKGLAKTHDEQKRIENTENEENPQIQTPSFVQLHEIRTQWNAIVREVEKQNRSLPFILKITRPERVYGHTVVLRFQYAFHKEKIIGDIKSKQLLEQAGRNILGIPELLFDGEISSMNEDGLEAKGSAPADIVTRVLDTFGGSVLE